MLVLLLFLFMEVTVTAYSSTPDQTNSEPLITASGKRVCYGVLAVSRDLKKILPYGSKVKLEGIGVYWIFDLMNSRYRRRVDIWFPSREQAKRFGKRKARLVWIGE